MNWKENIIELENQMRALLNEQEKLDQAMIDTIDMPNRTNEELTWLHRSVMAARSLARYVLVTEMQNRGMFQ